MAVKKGLGKGLDSLITDKVNTKPVASKNNPTPKSEHAADAIMMNITKVEPNREQPRKKFDEDALLELAESIKQYGVLQPLLVQEREDYYEIVAVAADVVTAQSPSAKKQAAKGSTVTVTLSPGQKPITVPNVVGASQSHAESALAGAGLKYTYADSQYSDTVPAGSVISQTKSGETVAAGTTITLTLSKGKQEISTNVSKGISYSGEGTVVKAEYKLVGKSGTVYDKGSYENTSSFTVSGTMKEVHIRIT